MRIPSETWSSLLYIGSSALLVRKLRESIISDETTDDARIAPLFGAAFLTSTAGSVQQQTLTATGYMQFLNPTMFLSPPSYAFLQGSYLLNTSATNYFQDWVWDLGGGGGDAGEATNLGGFGTFGDAADSPFASVSTFGQDVADKIGGVIGAAIGVGFKGLAGFALGLGLGPIGLAGSLLGMAMLDKAMPTSKWGSWSYFAEKVSDLFGWTSEADPMGLGFGGFSAGLAEGMAAALGVSDPLGTAIGGFLGFDDTGVMGTATFGESDSFGGYGSFGSAEAEAAAMGGGPGDGGSGGHGADADGSGDSGPGGGGP